MFLFLYRPEAQIGKDRNAGSPDRFHLSIFHWITNSSSHTATGADALGIGAVFRSMSIGAGSANFSLLMPPC